MRIKILYHEHTFNFEIQTKDSLIGRFDLSDSERDLLTQLLDKDSDEEWYLDDDGERLAEDLLFARSPWSMIEPTGTGKLLCRFIDIQEGSAHFQKQESYLGELCDYVREKNQS